MSSTQRKKPRKLKCKLSAQSTTCVPPPMCTTVMPCVLFAGLPSVFAFFHHPSSSLAFLDTRSIHWAPRLMPPPSRLCPPSPRYSQHQHRFHHYKVHCVCLSTFAYLSPLNRLSLVSLHVHLSASGAPIDAPTLQTLSTIGVVDPDTANISVTIIRQDDTRSSVWHSPDSAISSRLRVSLCFSLES